MNASVRWLNKYLQPGNVTADEADRALTNAGFPIESSTPLEGGDVRLDVEITSNRGDCLSHVGLAREIAAITGRTLTPPPKPAEPAPAAPTTASAVSLHNRAGAGCPIFTARVIRGVQVGPSPAWMVSALESIGQRPINNVVDVTNFVAAEFGQPTHVFDLGTLLHGAGGTPGIVVRAARRGERLSLLDGRDITLRNGELVIADGPEGERPISLAGIMGGALTQVTSVTTDVLLEAATWNPVTIRNGARRLGIRTEASHRFERIVDARTVDAAAARAADLIVQLAGGEVLRGSLIDGQPPRPRTSVSLRVARAAQVLGLSHSAGKITGILTSLGIEVAPGADGALTCMIPVHRPDLAREIDLIEEIARTAGLDALSIHETVPVRISAPQPSEAASRLLAGVLAGLGFFETVTFSFVTSKQAGAFMPVGADGTHDDGFKSVSVLAESRKADPVLRPSLLPSLLACRAVNQHGGASAIGGVRLFELAATFGQNAEGRLIESRKLALIADADQALGATAHDRRQAAVRLLRGALEQIVTALGGAARDREALRITPGPPGSPDSASGFEPGAWGHVELGNSRIGRIGLVSPSASALFDLAAPLAAAEVELAPLLALFPPRANVSQLPEFPGIERDLSLVVDEPVRWEQVSALVQSLGLERLESTGYVGTFRGQQIGAGKKSLTLRLRFRDPERTLRHEEVDPTVARLVEAASRELHAELRK